MDMKVDLLQKPRTGQFDTPEGICVDRRGYILIADTGNNRVQKFRRNGDYVMEWDGTDDGTKYNKPVYIIPDFNDDSPNRYYIVDQGNKRIVMTDEYGELIDEFEPKDADGKPLSIWLHVQLTWNTTSG
ncbi:MAG: hypothetical protein R2883_05650 [Caldisericia bacterium]